MSIITQERTEKGGQGLFVQSTRKASPSQKVPDPFFPRNKISRRGVAAVEFALILPVLLLIVAISCDFGRFPHTQIAVSSAARAGASRSIHHRPTTDTRAQWEAEIRQAVLEELAELPRFQANDLAVTIETINEAGGTMRTRVEVSYPFRTLINWTLLPSNLTIRESAVFRNLHP